MEQIHTEIEEQSNIIDIFESDVEMYLRDFCDKMNIEDIAKESQNRWNAALLHIQRYVFKPNKSILRADKYIYNNNLPNTSSSNCNAYDMDKLKDVCDMYINLCNRYDKEISIIGFSNLTGIDDTVIYNWANGTRNNTSSASTPSDYIYKKLSKMREESLSNMALSGKRNPVGVIAVLNNKCGWAEQKQVIKEERITVAPLDRGLLMAEMGGLLPSKPQDVVLTQ